MSDLVEFLLARIAEDEAAARPFDGWHKAPPEYWDLVASDEYPTVYVEPARVLAECDVKRRIVEREREKIEVEVTDDHRAVVTPGTWLLRLLARPYVEHPDYRDEWRRVDA